MFLARTVIRERFRGSRLVILNCLNKLKLKVASRASLRHNGCILQNQWMLVGFRLCRAYFHFCHYPTDCQDDNFQIWHDHPMIHTSFIGLVTSSDCSCWFGSYFWISGCLESAEARHKHLETRLHVSCFVPASVSLVKSESSSKRGTKEIHPAGPVRNYKNR